MPGSDTASLLFGLMRVRGNRVGLEIEQVSEVCLIKELSPLMVATPGVLGTITLRGDAIPVVDPGVFCGFADEAVKPALAVIVAMDGRRLALGVDELTGLAEVPQDQVQSFFDDQAESAPLLRGGFTKDGGTINIINPAKLFADSNVPTARDTWHIEREALGVGMKPYLTFESGGARFAVEAIKVHATVPRRAIEQNSLTSGSCLGSIVHHGRRVPVLNSNDVIGLGNPKDLTTSEIVVLRFPEGRTVGLAVEVIKRISMLDEACETLASASIRSATRFIRATFSNEDAVQSYLIDIAEMHGDTELLNMANLSEIDAPKPSLKRSQGGAPMPDDVVEEAKRYLVVRFGERLALPLTQVVRILAPPESFTPIVAGGMGLTGYCSIDGVSTPLFLAEDLLGSGGGKTRHTSRVVLAGPPDARFGLVVDEVESIETSSWRKDAASPSQFKSGLVDLKSSNGSRVLEWADLDRLGARLTERSLELTG